MAGPKRCRRDANVGRWWGEPFRTAAGACPAPASGRRPSRSPLRPQPYRYFWDLDCTRYLWDLNRTRYLWYLKRTRYLWDLDSTRYLWDLDHIRYRWDLDCIRYLWDFDGTWGSMKIWSWFSLHKVIFGP